MTPYEKAVWTDAAAALAGEIAKAARLALRRECASAPDDVVKHVFGAAVVLMIRELEEARLQRAISVALAESQP